jgi:hypothetical protein
LFTTHSIDRDIGIIDVGVDYTNKNGRIWTLCNVDGVYGIPSEIVLSIWNWINFWNLKMKKSMYIYEKLPKITPSTFHSTSLSEL